MFFQLLTNGWLTGRGIVRYASDAILGSSRITFLGDGRLVWAPVEDLLFGFALVLLTCAGWVRVGAVPRRLAPPLTVTATVPCAPAGTARRTGRLAGGGYDVPALGSSRAREAPTAPATTTRAAVPSRCQRGHAQAAGEDVVVGRDHLREDLAVEHERGLQAGTAAGVHQGQPGPGVLVELQRPSHLEGQQRAHRR